MINKNEDTLKTLIESLGILREQILILMDKANSYQGIDRYLSAKEKESADFAKLYKELSDNDLLLIQYQDCFIDSLLIRLRIFFDKSKHNPISFLNLLTEIRKNSDLFSKQYYFAKCSSSPLPQNILEGWYDKTFRNGLAGQIDQDIKYLKEKTKDIDRYIDMNVAHCDINKKILENTTINDLLALAEEIVKRFNIYHQLLTGTGCQHQNGKYIFTPVLLQHYFENN